MKKTIIALSILFFSTNISLAYYYVDDVNSVKTLKRQGFSDTTLQIVDDLIYMQGGIHGNYKPVYKKKHADNNLLNAYNRVKYYVDPLQDDGEFMHGQINFSNCWNGDSPSYALPKEEIKEIEDL